MLGPETVTESLMRNAASLPESVQKLYGITPRAILQMFQAINEGITKHSTNYTIKCSYIEVYNEAINDILCDPVNPGLKVS